MSNNNTTIRLILNESRSATSYYCKTDNQEQQQNLLHITEYKYVLSMIGNAIPVTNEDAIKANQHNSITILGTRGSGKTSFLLTIRKAIDANADLGHPVARANDLCLLDTIDPTLIEDKGHIFLTVISTITTKVEKEITKMECDPQLKDLSRLRNDWRKSLSKLANGLPSIDGIGVNNTDRWEDAEFVMDNGLVAINAARNLSLYFNEFLEKSLQIMKKKAFLLIFDDIDVDASKGWSVLETLRKYLHSARLITIVSGDLKLFTTAIRQKKWKHFGAEILKYEATEHKKNDGSNPKLANFNDIITELSTQYLLKIMQPSYRVHLMSLLEKKLINKKLQIFVKSSSKDKDAEMEIEDRYLALFKEHGINNPTETEVFKTFMLSLPIRSQIQFLLAYEKPGPENTLGLNATDVFISDLYEKNIDINLAKGTVKYISAIAMRLLLQEKRLFDMYQLQPNTTDFSLNASLFTLSLLISSFFKQGYRFLTIDYMIRIGYIRNISTALPYRDDTSTANSLQLPSINDLCERVGLFNDNVLRDTMGHTLGYLNGSFENNGRVPAVTHSFITLMGRQKKGKQKNDPTRFDSVFSLENENDNPLKNMLGLIPAFSLVYNHKDNTKLGYSPYMLISTIGELIKRFELVLKDGIPQEEIKEYLKKTLRELSQLRSYPVAGFTSKSLNIDKQSQDTDEEERYNDEDTSGNSNNINPYAAAPLNKFIDEIYKWLTIPDNEAPLKLAPYLIGKMSTRFFSALSNIQERYPRNIQLGQLFRIQIIAFMNAVMVEDIRENIPRSVNISINNVRFSDAIFIKNINTFLDYANSSDQEEKPYEKINLSRWLMSCPLFYPYLISQNGSILAEKLEAYCTGYFPDTNNIISITNDLDKIAINTTEKNTVKNNATPTSFPDKTYPILRTTINRGLTLLKNPVELANLLEQNGYPYWWFDSGLDRKNTKEANKQIGIHLSSIFTAKGKLNTATYKFRNHLKKIERSW